jgi:hypothetical protein
MDILRWIGKRWVTIRQESGFDLLEGWAIKEISGGTILAALSLSLLIGVLS